MRATAPRQSWDCRTATSGRLRRQTSTASSQLWTSITSCPAPDSRRAIRLRLGFRAWASTTRMEDRYPRTAQARPNSRLARYRRDLADVGVHLLHERLDGLEA